MESYFLREDFLSYLRVKSPQESILVTHANAGKALSSISVSIPLSLAHIKGRIQAPT